MKQYRLEILISPRSGLLDPQGKAIHHALHSLGFDGVDDVRVGKAIYLDVKAESAESAHAKAKKMCQKLLSNPVTEDFAITPAQELP